MSTVAQDVSPWPVTTISDLDHEPDEDETAEEHDDTLEGPQCAARFVHVDKR